LLTFSRVVEPSQHYLSPSGTLSVSGFYHHS
jgi:hypothetical protein